MKNKLKINDTKGSMLNAKCGITLIALIITVIILLILAGTAISIAINGGDLFGKAAETRETWNEAVEIEDNSLKDSLYALDMAADPNLAKSKLIVKVKADGTVESPYYVNYPSAKGTIKCRVLYNDSTYGLQLVAVNSITKVKLGSDDESENVIGEMGSLERAINSYNRAVITLNEKAEEYMETLDGSLLAKDARCVGSNPLNKNYPDNLTGAERDAEMFVADSQYTYMNEYNGKYFNTNSHYMIDFTRLWAINIQKVERTTEGGVGYWLATHKVSFLETNPEYGHSYRIPWVGETGRYMTSAMLEVKTDGTMTATGYNIGFRPVIVLEGNVKIIGGEGTEEVPYELGL